MRLLDSYQQPLAVGCIKLQLKPLAGGIEHSIAVAATLADQLVDHQCGFEENSSLLVFSMFLWDRPGNSFEVQASARSEAIWE